MFSRYFKEYNYYNEKCNALLEKTDINQNEVEKLTFEISTTKEMLEYDFKTEFLTPEQQIIYQKLIFQFSTLLFSFDTRLNNRLILEEIDSKIEELDKTESKILSHVLTLLGIFTAIITIIVSAISTTSTWLNNSKETSFIIAIVIPASITIFAVFILLILLKFLFFNAKKQNVSRSVWEWIILIICLIVLSICFLVCIIKQTEINNNICNDDNSITISDYVIDHENDKITYVYNGVEFTIECNYDLIHEDGLHYCTIHNKFE